MRKTQFTSLEELENFLLETITECMKGVGKEASALLKEHVEQDVYRVGDRLGRNYYYDGNQESTGQLRDSVTSTDPVRNGNEVGVLIYHDPEKMEHDADTFLHGSIYFSIEDIRELLPQIINEGLTGGLFGGKWENLKRPYFDNTIEEIESKDKFKQWMLIELAKRYGVAAQ